MTQFGDYNRRVNSSGNSRNIILLIVIIVQVLLCCTLSKVCVFPMANESKLEHNSRNHQLHLEKNKFIKDIART